MVDLRTLYFGQAAAENEVSADAELFRQTYLDRWGLLAGVETHERFLVLGPKGTGKSAAANFLRLEWERRYGTSAVFTQAVDFDELNRTQSPLAGLDKKLVGDVPFLTDSAWKLFISVRLLDSLLSDAACNLTRDAQVLQLAANLKQAELASDDFPQVLRRVREKRGLVGIPKVGEFEGKSGQSPEVAVPQLADALWLLVLNAETPNRHSLMIDGLDKAIGDNPAYWKTLAASIRVTDKMARRAREIDRRHIYVLVMCRSDVFRRVRFADAAKISADGAIHMDWSAEADNPRDVKLWEYISHKAQTSVENILEALPPTVRVGASTKVARERYILQFTRYTPRDMTLLFNSLKAHATSATLSNSQVRRSVDSFSSQHLLAEIISEATGLLREDMIDRFEQILSGVPRRVITRAELTASMVAAGFMDPNDVATFGEYLFLQGAIGNYRPGADFVQFYHRRDSYKFQSEGPWMLHSGLVYAFNIQWANRLDNEGSMPPSEGAIRSVRKPSKSPTRPTRVRRRRRGHSGEPGASS